MDELQRRITAIGLLTLAAVPGVLVLVQSVSQLGDDYTWFLGMILLPMGAFLTVAPMGLALGVALGYRGSRRQALVFAVALVPATIGFGVSMDLWWLAVVGPVVGVSLFVVLVPEWAS